MASKVSEQFTGILAPLGTTKPAKASLSDVGQWAEDYEGGMKDLLERLKEIGVIKMYRVDAAAGKVFLQDGDEEVMMELKF